MASVFPLTRTIPTTGHANGQRLARAMSRHVALTLLVFAAVQVWLIVAVGPVPGSRALPFLALALVAIVAIPIARRTERRWAVLARDALPCPALLRRYRRDRTRLWLWALLLPVAWVGSFLAVVRIAGFI